MRGPLTTLLNFAGFQAVWLCSVLGAANGLGWLGPLVLAVFAAAHAMRREVTADEFALAAFALLLGALVDSGYLIAGLLQFAEPGPLENLAPAWILSMWAGFALTLRHSLAWLSRSPGLAAVFGLIGGPLAYISGSALGGLEPLVDLASLSLVVGIAWALVTPLLFAFDRHCCARGTLEEPSS